MNTKCASDKVINPTSGRCVLKTGKIGIEIMKTQKKKGECNDDKITNPKTGRCILKTGKLGIEILRSLKNRDRELNKIKNAINSEWFLVTKNSCGYCAKAKSLLKEFNIKFTELEASNITLGLIYHVTDQLTNDYKYFPMIFHNSKFIGGFNELQTLKLEHVHSDTPYMKSPLHMIKTQPSNQTSFVGSTWHEYVAMMYLKYKYPQNCIVIPPDHDFKYYIGHLGNTSLIWNENNNTIIVPYGFWESVTKCLDSGATFIVMPFIFICSYPPNHANYLIYNSKTKEMERFEPNGFIEGHCLNPPDLESKIQKLFNKNVRKDMISKIYSPLDFCPYMGFQRIQAMEGQKKATDPGGFCAAWVVWYADIRMSNPNKNRKQTIKMALDQMNANQESFTEFIRSYAEFIVQIGIKLKDSKNPDKVFEEIFKK